MLHKMFHHSWLQTIAILPVIIASLELKSNAIASDIPSQTIPNSPQIAAISKIPQKGDRISVNGRIIFADWMRWSEKNNIIRTGISDIGLMQAIGLDLLNSDNPKIAPVEWFDIANDLNTKITSQYRYLDITDFAKLANFQIQVNNNTLVISSPLAKIQNIRLGEQSWGNIIVVDIDRPTPWQVNYIGQYTPPKPPLPIPNTPKPNTNSSPGNPNQKPTSGETTADDESKPTQKPNEIKSDEWSITLDATADAAVIKTWQNQSTIPLIKEISKPISPPTTTKNPIPTPEPPVPPLRSLTVENIKSNNIKSQTNIRLRIPPGWRPQVITLDNPNRLVIDIRPDHIIPLNILWAPGVQWRQEYITLGKDKFAAVWLEINPKQKGITFKPITNNPTDLTGSGSLFNMAYQAGTAAAINGGFFNRNTQQPLGAIRRDGVWLSSPILNRGAIAWNNQGEFIFGHLALQETLTTPTAKPQPILSLNSGYIQAGIARYTPVWGKNYTPLSNNEIIVTVQNNQVTNQQVTNPPVTNPPVTNPPVTNPPVTNQPPGNEVGKTQFPIPNNGYILVLRSFKNAADMLKVGTSVNIESVTIPADFNRYPQILAAGPILLQKGQIVLDPKAEGFSNAYIQQTAVRSVIGRTAQGNIIIAAIHNRPDGAAPTFAEVAGIIKQLGAVDALNFDGGSSTALYLGGQIINRPANTAARVHNGLGVFIQPSP